MQLKFVLALFCGASSILSYEECRANGIKYANETEWLKHYKVEDGGPPIHFTTHDHGYQGFLSVKTRKKKDALVIKYLPHPTKKISKQPKHLGVLIEKINKIIPDNSKLYKSSCFLNRKSWGLFFRGRGETKRLTITDLIKLNLKQRLTLYLGANKTLQELLVKGFQTSNIHIADLFVIKKDFSKIIYTGFEDLNIVKDMGEAREKLFQLLFMVVVTFENIIRQFYVDTNPFQPYEEAIYNDLKACIEQILLPKPNEVYRKQVSEFSTKLNEYKTLLENVVPQN